MAGQITTRITTQFVYYTSANENNEDSGWTVYAVEMRDIDGETVEGSETFVSGHATEAEADEEARYLTLMRATIR